MVPVSETAVAAYFAGPEAAVTWGALRSVAPHVRPAIPVSAGRICYRIQPATQALPDAQSAADTVKIEAVAAPAASTVDLAVSQLLRFKKFSEDWDGYGAAKPVNSSVDAARKFVRSLAPESIVPQPALHADGNAILFYRGDDVYAELEFVGTTVEFFARRGEKDCSSEFPIGAPLPLSLSEIGFST